MAHIIYNDTPTETVKKLIASLPVKDTKPLPKGKPLDARKYPANESEQLFQDDPLTLQREWREDDR